MQVRKSAPVFFRESGVPRGTVVGTRDVANAVERLHREMAEAVNANDVTLTSSATQPTPVSGQLLVWEDTGATPGQSTHYLVYNDGTSVVTFASVETT